MRIKFQQPTCTKASCGANENFSRGRKRIDNLYQLKH